MVKSFKGSEKKVRFAQVAGSVLRAAGRGAAGLPLQPMLAKSEFPRALDNSIRISGGPFHYHWLTWSPEHLNWLF